MRVLQLIDSLHPGGAERMAISLANELSEKIEASYLCATRDEGLLKNGISKNVHYTFLKKKVKLDFAAISRLVALVKKNRIEIIHAHSSSFFYAWLVKIMVPSIKLIWHDHYGNSELLEQRNAKILRFCSSKFSGIIAVNSLLAEWSKSKLKSSKVLFIKNFVSRNYTNLDVLSLFGEPGKRILCVANFRPQKDHQNLLAAFRIIKKKIPQASLHLVGNNDSDYGKNLKKYIVEHNVDDIYCYGELILTPSVYKQCNLGVLSSLSEGLPVALLEYGLNNLPVVVTDAGECAVVVRDFGKLVACNSADELARACVAYLEDDVLSREDAANFHRQILSFYSFNSIFNQLMSLYKGLA